MREQTYLPTLEDLYLAMGGEGISPLEDELYGNPMIPWDQGVDVAGGIVGPLWEGLRALKKGTKTFTDRLGNITKRDITPIDARRAYSPGVYGNPRAIAAITAGEVAPETGAMQRLFGPTRQELYEINRSKDSIRGDMMDFDWGKRPTGSKAVSQITTKRNAQRMIDTMSEGMKYPDLVHGSIAWYEMQPLYNRIAEISDTPVDDFWKLMSPMAPLSARSNPIQEIERGTHGAMLIDQGRINEFRKYGAIPAEQRGPDFPADLAGLPGSMAHQLHSGSLEKLADQGRIVTDQVKVPTYLRAHGTPETGFQNILPIADAHYARSTGLSDVRPLKSGGMEAMGINASKPELYSLKDWWEQEVTDMVGLNPVQGQAFTWNLFAPFTGVAGKVGKSKLEMISEGIMNASQLHGISPEKARDMILMREMGIPNLNVIGRPR